MLSVTRPVTQPLWFFFSLFLPFCRAKTQSCSFIAPLRNSCSAHLPAQMPTGFCHCVVGTVSRCFVYSLLPGHSRAGPGSRAPQWPCPHHRTLWQKAPVTHPHCRSFSQLCPLCPPSSIILLSRTMSFCTSSLRENAISLPPLTASFPSFNSQRK